MRNSRWLQIKADIIGIPVARPRITEAASWGAALLAGAAAGIFPSASQAAAGLLSIDRVYTPDPQRAAFEIVKFAYDAGTL